MAPTAPSIAVSAYVNVLESIQYSKQIGQSRFLKAIKANDPNGSVVVKVFIKPNGALIGLNQWSKVLQHYKTKLTFVSGALPYSKIIETDRAGYLIRQFIRTNVYDRISTRPFLEDVEKKWIVFQLLNTLAECHENSIYHGDIKTENILVTSWNWSLLCDFAPFKPVYLPEDNPGTFSFYFDTSQRRSCYLAPERFLSNAEELNVHKEKLTSKMDIFSLGCSIAEIFLEGTPIFTLSQLYKYKRGEYYPNLNGILDSQVQELVKSMISLNPDDRLSAKQYLENYRSLIFPNTFYTFMYEYFKNFNDISAKSSIDSNLQECDVRVNTIYNDFDKISFSLGFQYPVSETSPSNHTSDTVEFNDVLPFEFSLPGILKNYRIRSTSKLEDGEIQNTALIILGSIFSSLNHVHLEHSKIQALELIVALSERIDDEAKLDRSIPYIMSLLDDPSQNVQAEALKSLTQLLLLVDSIGPVNVLIFREYIIPRLTKLLKNSTSYVRMQFAICLPYLADVSLRFYEMATVLKSNVLETSIDPDTENIGIATSGMFDISRESLSVDFESFAISLLTDSESIVKTSLLKGILPLCSFLGKEKANDLVLSHLITYLNDKNSGLRTAFVESVVGLSVYVGTTSLEHYILPLLVQTLSDPEELVVIKVLHVFEDLLKVGLIRKDFIWDLLNVITKLIIHPNEWIKQGTLSLIITLTKDLSLADRYCMLYPIIRPYMEYDVTDFSWDTLYSVCTKPLPRSIYNLASTWSLRAESSLFWKQSDRSSVDGFGNRGFEFISNNNEKVSSIKYGQTEIPLSKEDKSWADRLVTSGLNEADLWKVVDLREYIFRVSRLSFRSQNLNGVEQGNVDIQGLGVLPRNVFFDFPQLQTESFESDIQIDINYDTEGNNDGNSSIGNNGRIVDSGDDRLDGENNLQQDPFENFPNGDNESEANKLSDNLANSLVLNNKYSKAAPSIMTNEENAYGELESSFIKNQNVSKLNRKSNYETSKNNIVHNSYTGKDENILKFLSSIKIEPRLDELEDFMERIPLKVKNLNVNKAWDPKGDLVFHLKEHSSSINSIDVSADHSFFVTGDDLGGLKLWDSLKLERNLSNSSIFSTELDSSITAIKFLKTYNCFGVATKDGYIRIMSIEYSLSKPNSEGSRIANGLNIIRETKLKNRDEYVVDFEFGESDSNTMLYAITTSCEIVGIDIGTMEIDFRMVNNPVHGIITSFAIDLNSNWVVVGTSKGILDLWDLRFKVHLKSWRFNAGFSIANMAACFSDYQLNRKKNRFVTIIGGTGESDVIIFDLGSGNCRELFTQCNEKDNFDRFGIVEINKENFDYSSIYEKNLDTQDRSLTSLKLIETNHDNNNKKFWVLAATSTYDLILWNVFKPEESKVVLSSGITFKDKEHEQYSKPIYSTSQINPNLRITTLKYPTESELSKSEKRRRKKTKGLRSEEHEKLIKGHHDRITGLALALVPYEMIISVDRSGTLNVYK